MTFSERLNEHMALRDAAKDWTQAVLEAERAWRATSVDDPGAGCYGGCEYARL